MAGLRGTRAADACHPAVSFSQYVEFPSARSPGDPMRRIVALAVVALPSLLAAQTYRTEKFNIGGDGGHDYITADPATGRVYVSRGTHVMVVEGATGKVV